MSYSMDVITNNDMYYNYILFRNTFDLDDNFETWQGLWPEIGRGGGGANVSVVAFECNKV